jgi:putative phosphoribosyl transferase
MNFLERITQQTVELAKAIDPLYVDRHQAGLELAELIDQAHLENPYVFAIPNGGIPVALPVCERLTAPLYFGFASKIHYTSDKRFSMGVVTHDAELLNDDVVEMLSMSGTATPIDELVDEARHALNRKVNDLEPYNQEYPCLENATAIILDDGVSTGFCALGVAESLQKLHPSRIIVATPVMSVDSSKRLRSAGIEIVCPHISGVNGFMVDNHYQDFAEVGVAQLSPILESFYGKRR